MGAEQGGAAEGVPGYSEELDRLGEHGAKSFIRMAENYLKQTDDWKHIDIDKEIQKSERAENFGNLINSYLTRV